MWRAERGNLTAANARGLMVPGLLTSGSLAALPEGEARRLLGEPDCPPGRAGPFAGDRRLVYWVGKTGTRRVKADDPAAGPGCLYLRVLDGRVVEW